jgi:hypothetical protein
MRGRGRNLAWEVENENLGDRGDRWTRGNRCGPRCDHHGRADGFLGVIETERVEKLIRRLRERGTAIVLVSHSLDQVFRLADRVCILRRGRRVGIRIASETSGEEIVAMITGLV